MELHNPFLHAINRRDVEIAWQPDASRRFRIWRLRTLYRDLVQFGDEIRRLPRRIARSVYEQGALCLPVVLIVGMFTGLVLGLQGYYVLNRFGSRRFVGRADFAESGA